MQHMGADTTMESDSEEQKSPPPPRGRNNSKPKVLVRSHAMREETSPPREPTPIPNISPCIKLTPSNDGSPQTPPSPCSNGGKPPAVLSPSSVSRGNSGTPSPACASPNSTVVPSPASMCSPLTVSPHLFLNNGGDAVCTEADSNHVSRINEKPVEQPKAEIIIEQTSQYMSKKYTCHCLNTSCVKCLKNQERNFNNNISSNVNNNVVNSSNTLTVNRVNTKGKFRQQGSQGSFEGSLSNSPCLSRDSSSEQYTDTTGVDLDLFIPETLNRNAKDRALMLKIEQDLVSLAKDKIKTHYKFPPMSSYQRMLVHRCAAYFGMDHNIESSGKCVVVNKTKTTRIPDVGFKEHVKDDLIFTEEPRRSILKRDSNSVEDYSFKSPDRQQGFENRRSKSFEEREEEYEKVRRRIFNREHRDGSSADEYGWAEVPWSSTDSENSTRYRLVPPDQDCRLPGRLLKVQSEEAGDTLRPCVAKSYSFGGYGGGVQVLTRGDSLISTHSAGPRLFTKQDSGASSVSWRLSPSSSGYKSQSQRSESITPSPTSTPYPLIDANRHEQFTSLVNDSAPCASVGNDTQLVWAVTDIHNVPKGSIIINPQTGQPIKNIDGSIYHYDPVNPPYGFGPPHASKPPPSPHKAQLLGKEREASPKRRSLSSPCKKPSFINSATSPSLPYAPPPQNKNFVVPGGDVVPNVCQQQYPVYGNSYAPTPPQDAMYQSPCVMYAQYNLPMQQQYEGRIDQQFPAEVPSAGYYMNMPDSSVIGSSAPPMAYQTSSYWNQQPVSYFTPQTHTQPPHRLSYSNPGQQGYISNSYASNFASSATQNQDVVPIFPQQQLQLVYPPQPTQQNAVIYPNQPLIYTQNSIYPHQMYPPHYPQNAATPNSTSSSISNLSYCRQMQELNQGINHLNVNPNSTPPIQPPGNYAYSQSNKPPVAFDARPKGGVPKGNKYSPQKNFVICSSQSSTGTNSPATTIIANYCGNPGMYKTPPPTPPIQNLSFGYGVNYMPPVLYRQSSTSTNRSSRSPTPAAEIPVLDRQRMPLPPTLYQGMPYVLQGDTRIVSGRGQPNSYRQPPPSLQQRQCFTKQNADNFNRSHNNKNRRSRGNKISSLPSSGKPCNM